MNITAHAIFHIYNQGNNREKLFFEDADYFHFLELFKKFVLPYCNVLAYCLMPNHFHFLIYATEDSARIRRIGNIDSCELTNGFRLLQSNYAQYINKKQGRSGSLFRQRLKIKPMTDGDTNYSFTAFNYIHQNPLVAGLVSNMEDWQFSSFLDYAGVRNGTICNKRLAFEIIGFDKQNFVKESYKVIDKTLIPKLFC